MLSISKLYNILYSFRSSFFSSLAHLFGFLSIKIYLFSTLILNILFWVFVFLFKKQLSGDLAILHFNVDFGVDLIGNVNRIFLMPAFGFLIFVFNFLFLMMFIKNNNFKFVIHLLLLSALLANLFLILALGPIYFINF